MSEDNNKEKPTYEELEKNISELVDFFNQFVMMKFPFRVKDKEPITIECLVPNDTALKIAEELKK